MAVYSHSKLQSFEQCKYKYKLKYIDKIPSPIEKSIEAHLGTCVHDALEWLYKEVLQNKLPTLDETLATYTQNWQNDWSNKIVIVKQNLTDKDYFNKGIKFIIDYYTKHAPFKDGTKELEKKIWVTLEKDFPHKIIGFIDRLVYNQETKEYEVHDYKTAKSLPNRNKFEQDRQLALYSIGIKQLYGEHHPVLLTWHYLNHNMRIDSRRTDDQLKQLKKEIMKLIREIENNKEWPTTKMILCDWCEYKTYCKAHGNCLPEQYKHEQSTLDLSKKENGTLIKKENPLPNNSEDLSNFPTVAKYIKG
jgi:putative RecB family exonuclease